MNNDNIIKQLLDEGRLRVDAEVGLVYSPHSNTPLKPLGSLTKKGYLRTSVNRSGVTVSVLMHRVVWISVNGVPSPDLFLDHKNTIKTDNRIVNLELVSNDENMKRAARNGLTKGGWRDGIKNEKGQFIGKKAAGRLLDGREHNEFPTVQPVSR